MGDHPPERIVVVGGGVAAQSCAFELRRQGYDAALTMVSAEPCVPYDRTLLSKEFLEGVLDAEDLELAAGSSYADAGVDLRLGVAAAGIDPVRQRVELADGDELAYDRAVIATGGAAHRPGVLMAGSARTLRTLDDAAALRDALAGTGHLLVVGAGFVGGEVSSTAAALGVRVTLVETLPAPLSAAVGSEVGGLLADLHRQAGIELLTGTTATAVRQRDDGIEVTTGEGRRLEGDLLVVGTGMQPRLDWLRTSGIEVDGGVVTDELCRTNAPGVLAAGDCARWWNPRYGRSMRVEHWDTAARHGAAAARSAVGLGEAFDPVPFFWSYQHETRLQSVGHAPCWDRVEVDGSSPRSFVARYYEVGSLVAAFAAGNAGAVRTAKREIEEREEVAA